MDPKDLPAFPTHTLEPNPNGGEPRIIWQEGMTLRDYFAAKAMQGLCARTDGKGFDFITFHDDPMRVALWAYDVADQMIAARQS